MMRAHYYWPNSGLNMTQMEGRTTPRTVFWVSATLEEAVAKVLTYMSEEAVAAFHALTEVELEDSYRLLDRFYFFAPAWMPESGSDPPVLDIYIRPHSGMWNGRRPWIAIGPPMPEHLLHEPEGVEIGELAELEQLRFDIINRYHLAAP